ncbi:hypothetical protein C8J56DRAFT_936291 [Mycena floridula]|nr:hypothetical protein C8J56DRAFT_936291 [Mycena floridula]
MPSIPKLIKRISSYDIRNHRDSRASKADTAKSLNYNDSQEDPVPLLPSISRGLSLTFSKELQVSIPDLSDGSVVQPQNSDRTMILHPSTSELTLSPTSEPVVQGGEAKFTKELPPVPPNDESTSRELALRPPGDMVVSSGAVPSENSQQFAEMSREMEELQSGKSLSKGEKHFNQLSDLAVGAASKSTGAADIIQTMMANEEVKMIGTAIINGLPGLMSGLEELSKVHPFIGAAYLPFKFLFNIEMKRQDNLAKRSVLFDKMQDMMTTLLELQGFQKDDVRTDAQGRPILGRLKQICDMIGKLIQDCGNVLSAQAKRNVFIKFVQAPKWNTELVRFGVRFEETREELKFTLQMRTMSGVEAMRTEFRKEMFDMLTKQQTSENRPFKQFIKDNSDGDGEENIEASASQILRDENKCKKLLELQDTLSPRHSTGSKTDEDSTTNAIETLRSQFREDVAVAIEKNMEKFKRQFDLGIAQLEDQLTDQTASQADRVIRALGNGPEKRIKDNDWRGRAKTRALVLAIRDYFVERFERSKLGTFDPPPAKSNQREEEEDNPANVMGQPLPDEWIIPYLDVKGLLNLQQALDPDLSGYTTVSELNKFTQAKPEGWSLPKWIGYWAKGWRLFASRYCSEIDDIFRQMEALRAKITIAMPGNMQYVDLYLDGVWPQVTALTGALDRDLSSPWLIEEYQDYASSVEKVLTDRLEKIKYNIDTHDTVQLITGKDNMETVVLPLLAVILRQHLLKLHLCLQEEIADEGLDDDADTFIWVTDAAWRRFKGLKEIFKHQQVVDMKQAFDWFSAGIFRNFLKWQHRIKPDFYKTSPPMDNYNATPMTIVPPVIQRSALKQLGLLNRIEVPQFPTGIAVVGGSSLSPSQNNTTKTETSTASFSHIQQILSSGKWYGYHLSEPDSSILSKVISAPDKPIILAFIDKIQDQVPHVLDDGLD